MMRLESLARTLFATLLAGTVFPGTLSSVAQDPLGAQATTKFGKVPLAFELNRGQTDPRVQFLSRGKGYTAYVNAGGMVLSLRPTAAAQPASSGSAISTKNAQSPSKVTLQFSLVGASQNPAVVGEDPLPGKVNYFIGNNPATWRKNVPTYSRVRYTNVYPGIDLIYYGNHQELEYDFAVSPGSDPGQIQFAVKGANQMHLDAKGNLILTTANGDLHFQAPQVYQQSGAVRIPVSGAYQLTDASHVRFQVFNYDASKPLVIDPVLLYSTYLGGSGNDQPSGIAVDGSGNLYIAGTTDSADFPLATIGSLAPNSPHVFVAKLDASGSNLLYVDYIGGNNQDYGFALALDSANEVYVTGSTASSDFPLVNPYQAVYPGSFNAFVTKLSSDGSSLLYSTYLGGNGSDHPATIAIDGAGDMLVAGNTTSTNFPVANAYQATASANGGGLFGNYGFITKFSPDGASLVYSTYLAGNSNVPLNCGGTPCWPEPYTVINGLALDGAGDAFVGGATNTYNFPTTPAAYLGTDTTSSNGTVGFIGKLDGSGNLSYSTYFYESSGTLTNISAIAVDSLGSAYVTGAALSDGTFPLTSTSICDPGVYGWACSYGFITKLDPTGSSLMYSTFLGPNNFAAPVAIALDAHDDAYVVASSSSNTFGLVNGIESYTSGDDAVMVEIDPLGTSQLFATFLGGMGDETPSALALDSTGNMYVVGTTDSTDLPVDAGAFQTLMGGNVDAFLMKVSPASASSVSLTATSVAYATTTLGTTSQAQTVVLRNMGSAQLSIASIMTTGDFAETDNCGTSVPAAGSCSFSITFSPTAPGSRTGSIVIQDDAIGSPSTIVLTGDAYGSAVVLSPPSLTFAAQQVAVTSASQTLTLTNSGNAALNISGIQATGDFAETNDCSSTLAASSSCTISVTFTPTAAGTRAGTLTINDDALGNPQTVPLAGIGTATPIAIAVVTPASLAFSAQPLGAPSATQTVILTNTGNATLNIAQMQATGDFTQTSDCAATLSATASCTIQVTFTPSALGVRSGNLTLSDNASGNTQVVGLAGTGADFSLTSSNTSTVVKAGWSATYQLSVSPVGGSFTNPVKLNCTGLPASATCSLSPSTVTPGGSSATATLTISTKAGMAQAETRPASQPHGYYPMWIQAQGIGLFGIVLAGSRKRFKKVRFFALFTLLVAALACTLGCGGPGISSQSKGSVTPQTYTVTVVGDSGSLQHSLPLTLTVQ
ncbi:MAG TPA: choice-of-anchor D domain-containing protein [Candidatus Sulfotelmatobacter sp.]